MSMKSRNYRIVQFNSMGCDLDAVDVTVEDGEDEGTALNFAMREWLRREAVILDEGDTIKIVRED